MYMDCTNRYKKYRKGKGREAKKAAVIIGLVESQNFCSEGKGNLFLKIFVSE